MTELTEPPSGADGSRRPSPSAASATARKRPIYEKWWFWALTVVILGAIGAGGGALATKTPNPASPASDLATRTVDGAAPSAGAATTSTVESTAPPSGQPTTTAVTTPSEPLVEEEPSAEPAAETPPPAAKPGKWVRVVQMSGYGNQRSAPFRLTGGAIRLKYSVTDDEARADMYVLEEDVFLRGAGGVPAVMAIGAVSDQIDLERDAGSYCVEITCADSSWVVSIEEQR